MQSQNPIVPDSEPPTAQPTINPDRNVLTVKASPQHAYQPQQSNQNFSVTTHHQPHENSPQLPPPIFFTERPSFLISREFGKKMYLLFNNLINWTKTKYFQRSRPILATLLLGIGMLLIGFIFIYIQLNYETTLPQNHWLSKIQNHWNSFDLHSDDLNLKLAPRINFKARSYRPELQITYDQTNKTLKITNKTYCITVQNNQTGIILLEDNENIKNQTENQTLDSSDTKNSDFQLQLTHQNTFLGLALKKYSFYEQHIQKIEKQIMTANLNAIRQAQQFDKIQFRYNEQGQMIEWDETQHRLGLKTLTLFPMLDIRETTPHMYTSYWDLLKLSCCSFLVQDKFGWRYLHDMLEGKGHWRSTGSKLTLGSLSQSGFDYMYSDFQLFVPSIIRFVFPYTIEDNAEIMIYGIRMRYDLYRKKETYVFREQLGKFKIVKTDTEKQKKMAIRRDFYCESVKCQQALSLVKIISRKTLQICSIKIESIYAYDWNEGRI